MRWTLGATAQRRHRLGRKRRRRIETEGRQLRRRRKSGRVGGRQYSHTHTGPTPTHHTPSTPVLPCTHDSTETTTLFLLQPSTQSDRSALTLSAAPLRRGHAAKSKGLTRLAGIMLLAYRDLLCDRVEFGIVSGGSLESPVNKGWLIESESSSPACFSPFASLSAHPPLGPRQPSPRLRQPWPPVLRQWGRQRRIRRRYLGAPLV